PALDHAQRRVEHVAELDRLREVAVEDVALVLDVDVVVPLSQLEQDLALAHHLVLLAEDGEVVEHGRSELLPNLPRTLAGRPVEQRAQLPLGIALERLRHIDSRVRESPFGGAPARAATEGD